MEAIPPIWGSAQPSDVPQELNDSLYAIIHRQAGAMNLSLSPDGTLLAVSYVSLCCSSLNIIALS